MRHGTGHLTASPLYALFAHIHVRQMRLLYMMFLYLWELVRHHRDSLTEVENGYGIFGVISLELVFVCCHDGSHSVVIKMNYYCL